MRMIWRPYGFACLLAAGLLFTPSASKGASGPTVHVRAIVNQSEVRLEAQANGPFSFSSYRPSPNLVVVDLTGVSAAKPGEAEVVSSNLVQGYRLLEYTAGEKPVTRLEILSGSSARFRTERQSQNELTIVFAPPAPSFLPTSATGALASPKTLPGVTTSGARDSKAISRIQVAKLAETTQVLVKGKGRLDFHVLRLRDPERLVLDFSGARLAVLHRTVPSQFDPVRDVRAAQFTPTVARIVIDLEKSQPYHIAESGDGVTVEFAPATVSGGEKTPAAGREAVRIEKTSEPAAPLLAQPSASHATRASNENSVVTLPTSPTAPVLASLAPSPAKKVDASASVAEPAPARSEGDDPVAAAPVAVTGNSVHTPMALVNGAPAPMVQGATKYTGEPISVNLKDVDLKDFFRLIHEISGLNVVLDPNVKGTLTIVLDDVPWDQALDIVLKNNDLDKQLEGNVLRIATKETLRKEAQENQELAKAQAEAADVVTTTRVLSYAKSDDLVPTIKKFLSSRGDVLSDSRTNTLIIRDIPSVLPVIDNLIRELDKKSQQVEIEARVVAANRSFAREIGSQFAFASSATHGRNLFGGATAVGTSPIIRNSPPLPVPPLVVGSSSSTSGFQLPLNTNLGATVATSGMSYAFSSPNFALDYIITMAESKGVGKLLSKPRVITQNNQKASVKQGTKIPIQTVINNTISVQYIDAVLELSVTPQITAEGTVFMDVHVENTQIDPAIPRVNGIPALDTESADTRVLVNDGGTVVIGGIIISSQRTDIQQVPLFGSLPLLGHLFRHTTVTSQSQELLFFLTPRILPT